jgi:selenocysteine-specific elongation factor
MATIGGGTVLDSHPAARARRGEALLLQLERRERGEPADLVALVLEQRGSAMSEGEIAEAAEIGAERASAGLQELLSSGRAQPIRVEGKPRFIDLDTLGRWERDIQALVDEFHVQRPREAGMEKETLRSRLGQGLDAGTFEAILARLAAAGELQVKSGIVSSATGGRRLSAEEEAEKQKILAAIRDGGFGPPFLRELQETIGLDQKKARDLISILLEEGAIEHVTQDFYLAAGRLAEAEGMIREHVDKTGKLEVGDMKTLLDLSRKYSIPLLEYFDRQRVTKRVGDYRVLV